MPVEGSDQRGAYATAPAPLMADPELAAAAALVQSLASAAADAGLRRQPLDLNCSPD